MLTLKNIFENYHSSHQVLLAFNIDSFEIYQAVEAAVTETGLPCIVQLSPKEDKFITFEKLFLLVRRANLENLPIYLNLDHGTDAARLVQAAKMGFDMLHLDTSSEDYNANLQLCRDFVVSAKAAKPEILIEAEFTPINSQSSTDPKKAAEFITATKADLLAVSIGSRHGNDPTLPETVNLELLSQIHQQLPQTFFTLHGGSGIPEDQIKQAAQLGVVKVNINTDLRQSFLTSLRRQLLSVNSEKIYDFFIPAINDLQKIIVNKLKTFSTP